MSLFADFFSVRRRDQPYTSYPPVKTVSAEATKRASLATLKSSAEKDKRLSYPVATVDEDKRRRRKSLTTKYQTFFSNISQDFRNLGPGPELHGNSKTPKPGDSTTVPAVNPAVVETVTPVTIIEPQESQKSQESHEPAQDAEIPEKPRLRRRPKTPVRRIGELEGYAQLLSMTGCSPESSEEAEATRALQTASAPSTTPKSLRKVGGKQDLRRSSLDSDGTPKSPNLSDVETVVGSESPGSESPGICPRRLKHDSHHSFRGSWSSSSTTSHYSTTSEKDFAVPASNTSMKKEALTQDISTTPSDLAHNIEMQICLDLLKTDLSSALSPKNPSDSTLALQIWLMIESYESLKQRLHKQLLQQVGPGKQKTSEYTFQAMDHWLEALYSVYNTQLQERRQNLRGWGT